MSTAPNTMLSDSEIEAALAEIESGTSIPSLDDGRTPAPASDQDVVAIPVNAGRAPLKLAPAGTGAAAAATAPAAATSSAPIAAGAPAATADPAAPADASAAGDNDLLAADGGRTDEPTWHWWTPVYATADTMLDLLNLPLVWLPTLARRVLGQVAAVTLLLAVAFAVLGPMLRAKNTPLDYLQQRKDAALAPPPPPPPKPEAGKAEGAHGEGGGHGGEGGAKPAGEGHH